MKQNDNGKTEKYSPNVQRVTQVTYILNTRHEIRNLLNAMYLVTCHVLLTFLLLFTMHSEFRIINYVNIEHFLQYFPFFIFFSFGKIERKKLIQCKDLRRCSVLIKIERKKYQIVRSTYGAIFVYRTLFRISAK